MTDVDPEQTATGRGGPVRVDVTPSRVELVSGHGEAVVEITNTDEVIRQLAVSVLGVDAGYALADSPVVALFPDERATVTLSFDLPEEFPAGDHVVGIEISDLTDPIPPAIVEIAVVVAARPRLQVRAEPGNVMVGKKASYNATVENRGNGTAYVSLSSTDPERLTTGTFTPAVLVLPPGQSGVARLEVSGKRPLMGAPAVRVVTVHAVDSDDPNDPLAVRDEAVVSMVQRPRLSRRLFALAGLLMTATVLALTFTVSFKRVATATKAQEALLKQSLGVDAPAAATNPGSVSGAVSSSTGEGIDGVALALYDVDKGPNDPVRAAVTQDGGTFAFAGLGAGTYRLKIAAAGFGDIWYPEAAGYDEAQDLAVEEGKALSDLAVVLAGRPASVAGHVVGDDLKGVLVSARLPASADGPGAVVRSLAVAADGAFLLADLPAPATYEVVAEGPAMASDVRTVSLATGAAVDDLSLLLRKGDGVVAGVVSAQDGTAVSGATVTITDGKQAAVTTTLSGGSDTAGHFEIRDLRTPGTYSLSVEVPGYKTESQTLVLDAGGARRDLTLTLVPATGAMSGIVRDGAAAALGGVTVTVTGGDMKRVTSTLSVVNDQSPGGVGTWSITGLPVPGTYTVSFTGTDLVSQALAVELTTTQPARTDVDVTLVPSVATVRGIVRELESDPDGPGCRPDDSAVDDCPGRLAGVTVTLGSSTTSRTTITADIITGAFRFDRIPPGAYTLTFSRVGSSPQTLFVELRAGDDRVIDDVYLERQARIEGQVTTTDGNGLPNVGVRIYRLGQYPNVVAATTVTDASGNFTVVGLDAPETYVIEYQVPAGGPVRSSRQIFLRPGQIGVASVQF